MRYLILLLAILCCGCTASRCSVAVYGEVDEVTVEARYEVGVPSGRAK